MPANDHMLSWTPDAADVIAWIIIAAIVVVVLIKCWPFLVKFVHSVDLIASLPGKLDAIGARFDEQDKTLDDVRRMVTENHHENADPTLPDRISDVHKAIEASESRAQQRWDEHLAYSATIAERVAAVERRLEAALPQPDEN